MKKKQGENDGDEEECQEDGRKNVSQERRGGGEGDNRSNERPRPRVQSAL